MSVLDPPVYEQSPADGGHARVTAGGREGELGFCSFLYHVGGALNTGDQVNMWVRAAVWCSGRAIA
jgi:hypothetical protein